MKRKEKYKIKIHDKKAEGIKKLYMDSSPDVLLRHGDEYALNISIILPNEERLSISIPPHYRDEENTIDIYL